MKKLLIGALLTSLLSTSAFANREDDRLGTTEGLAAVAGISALGYASGTGALVVQTYAYTFAGAAIAMSTMGAMELSTMHQKVQEIVNSEVQEFQNSGKMPMTLRQTVDLLKSKNSEMSDAEAVDEIVKSINQ